MTDNPSEYYAVPDDEQLDVDGGDGSDASEGGDDTEDLDAIRHATDQEFVTMDGGDE